MFALNSRSTVEQSSALPKWRLLCCAFTNKVSVRYASWHITCHINTCVMQCKCDRLIPDHCLRLKAYRTHALCIIVFILQHESTVMEVGRDTPTCCSVGIDCWHTYIPAEGYCRGWRCQTWLCRPELIHPSSCNCITSVLQQLLSKSH